MKEDSVTREKNPPRADDLVGAVVEYRNPGRPVAARDALTEVLQAGAQELLRAAIEAEVDDFLAQHRELPK